MPPRPELASLLVAHKVATAREIERVSGPKGREERPLWLALIDAGVVAADELFALLREHSNVPVVTRDALAAAPSREVLVAVLSKEESLTWGVLVLELSSDGKRAQLAMVDPTDESRLRALAAARGLSSAQVFLAERAVLSSAIEAAYLERDPISRATVEPAGKVGQRSELEVAERLEQILVQAATGLGAALEVELVRGGSGASTFPREAGRLARELARELQHDRRRVALAGLAAMLVQLDALRRARHADDELSLFDELGWAAAGEDGLLGVARALTAQSAGFARPATGGPLQRVVQAVTDYLSLASADGALGDSNLDDTEQLLRTSSAGTLAIDALLRVLRRDLADRTPAATPLPETGDGQSAVTTVRAAARQPRGAGAVRVAPEERTQPVSLPGLARPEVPSRER